MEELRTVLADRGIKPTYQRLTILSAIASDRSHATIRNLHAALVKKIPTLSKTTLYTTLELFAAEGLVRALTIDPGEIRYDGVNAPHHHFFCAACGRILDLDLTCARERAGEIHGHRIDEVHGYFKGICRDCLTARTTKTARPFRESKHHPRRRVPLA